MGYYSTLTINTSVKKSNIKDVRGILAGIKIKIAAQIAEDWEHELNEFSMDDDGEFNIKVGDWNAKWYNSEGWIYALAPFLKDGDIELIGEEGEKYGYRIIKGIAYDLHFSWAVKLGDPLKKKEEK